MGCITFAAKVPGATIRGLASRAGQFRARWDGIDPGDEFQEEFADALDARHIVGVTSTASVDGGDSVASLQAGGDVPVGYGLAARR